MPQHRQALPVLSIFCVASACANTYVPPPVATETTRASPQVRAIVDAPDRTEMDRQLDPGHRPAALLTSLDVKQGMRVGELIAGAGYTAELLARAVAPNGVVYAENPLFVFKMPKWRGVRV